MPALAFEDASTVLETAPMKLQKQRLEAPMTPIQRQHGAARNKLNRKILHGMSRRPWEQNFCDGANKKFQREKFFGGAKILKKLDRVVAIDFVQESLKSEPSSRFLGRSKFQNSHATFWRIQPIVPGFMRS